MCKRSQKMATKVALDPEMEHDNDDDYDEQEVRQNPVLFNQDLHPHHIRGVNEIGITNNASRTKRIATNLLMMRRLLLVVFQSRERTILKLL